MEKHLEFIVSLEKRSNDVYFHYSQFLKLSGLYWALTSLFLLNRPNDLNHKEILEFVLACQNADGGFGGNVKHDSHLLYTLSAIQLLVMMDKLDAVDVELIVKYIASLQNEDGSFCGDSFGEVDSRFSYCAFSSLSLLKRLDSINCEKGVEFVRKCANFDGGFGAVPHAESHAGQIFCCVGVLSIMNQLQFVDEKLDYWLCKRQLPNGGLNGRPQKLEDVCYSWWVLSSLAMRNKTHWIDLSALEQFIQNCADENGGFSDRPGDMPDIFHTLFALAGLSLIKNEALEQVNPVYCMPQKVLNRHFNKYS